VSEPTPIVKQCQNWLVDLQLADDPKQYLLARVIAHIVELEQVSQRFADRVEYGN